MHLTDAYHATTDCWDTTGIVGNSEARVLTMTTTAVLELPLTSIKAVRKLSSPPTEDWLELSSRVDALKVCHGWD